MSCAKQLKKRGEGSDLSNGLKPPSEKKTKGVDSIRLYSQYASRKKRGQAEGGLIKQKRAEK